MTIKDLFTKSKVAIVESAESASADLESTTYLDTKIQDNASFIPFMDFGDPSVFAKFGSAEKYYTTGIERIYNTFPYDGSKSERLQFDLSSSYIEQWLYENKYPKTTGYAIFSADGWGGQSSIADGYGLPANLEYITAYGGLHTASAGMNEGELYKNFDKSIKFDLSNNRTQNFRVDPTSGTTIEFWLNKKAFATSSTEKEVIIDLWNGEAIASADYGRLTVYMTGSGVGDSGANPFRASLRNGSQGFDDQSLASSAFTTSSIADSNWHHYAISFLSEATGVRSYFYVDGVLENETSLGSGSVGELSGRVDARIGALQTAPRGTSAIAGSGKLSGSIDEFRFWKTRRTSKQINMNWFQPVFGGANTEDSNTSLGCYYKFNEGIVGNPSTDGIVLDFSGRLTNGVWTGYAASHRNTGSCFVSASTLFVEPPDPIIYSAHPQVVALSTEMATSGSDYDLNNTTYLYNKMPQFIRDDDETTNDFELKNLMQIMSSYFDTLYAQTKILPALTQKNYLSSSTKPLPFANRLLESKGFVTSELFVDTEILEFYNNNDMDNLKYQQNVDTIKNLIYHNIYNNLDYIMKSKGTEKSMRNLLRCFGIDDELVKLNLYTDGGIHYFTDVYKNSSITKKYMDFNNPVYFESTIYQTSSVNNPNVYISGSGMSGDTQKLERYNAFTFEVDAYIPEKIDIADEGFFDTPFISSSIAGFHQPATETEGQQYHWTSENNIANLQIYLVKDQINSERAKFLITNEHGTLYLTSSYYDEIYSNNRWNLSVRVAPDQYGVIGSVSSGSNPSYELTFYGTNYQFGEIRDDFKLTASLNFESGSSYICNPKTIYAGAHYENFTGSLLTKTDVQVGGCRYWFDKLSDKDLQAHGLDVTSIGVDNATRNGTMFTYTLEGVQLPRADMLALSWDFDTVTGSNSSGNFDVFDLTSGSTSGVYGWIDNIVEKDHPAIGSNFAASSTTFVDNELIYNSRKELPEISVGSDNINIKGDRKTFFIKDDDVSDNFYSLEKSMYQIISEEMLSMFASAVEFNNLIGEAVDRYRPRYKNLDLMRQLFFEKVELDMDFDKFTNYYKWIDSSISEMMNQLYPFSARHSDSIADIVESHILERNKYQNKFPLTTRLASTEGSARGIGELTYKWKFGHSPTGSGENENCLWQKERKERTDIGDRQVILDTLNNYNDNNKGPLLAQSDGTMYRGSTFAINRLAKPYKVDIGFNDSVHGGINYSKIKDRDFVHNAVQIHGPVTKNYPRGIPQNVLAVGLGEGQGVDTFVDCDDVNDPNLKKKYRFTAVVGRFSEGLKNNDRQGQDYISKVKGEAYWPSNLVSGNVEGGYHDLVTTKFKSGSIITNLHSDTFSPTNEIGLQSPFTNAWVGGHQSRHVDLNKSSSINPLMNGLDDQYSRPEAWRLLLKECADGGSTSGSASGSNDGAMGFVGPDYGGPYPDKSRKYAFRYREERTKRPVNLRNIQSTTASAVLGNYSKNYEVVSTFGMHGNSPVLKEATGSLLPEYYDTQLPASTHYQTLIGVSPFLSGNVFGQPDPIFKTGNNRQSNVAVQEIVAGAVGQYASVGLAFKVPPHDVVPTGSILTVPDADGDGATFEIDAAGSDYLVNTNGSDTNFFNNLQTALVSTSGLYSAAPYTAEGGTPDICLDLFSPASAPAKMPNLIVNDPYSIIKETNDENFYWAGWIRYPSTATGVIRSLWRIRDTDQSRDKAGIYITANGDDLIIFHADETANRQWNYNVGGSKFDTTYANQWVHIAAVFTSASVLQQDSVALYINGVSASLDTFPFLGRSQFSCSAASVFNICQDGEGANTTTRSQFSGAISQWVFGTGSLGTPYTEIAGVESLYNHGYVWNTDYSASNIGAHWPFAATGSFGTDNITRPGAKFYSSITARQYITASNAITNYEPGVFTVKTEAVNGTPNLKTMRIATFSLTASAQDADYNAIVAANSDVTYINGVLNNSPFFSLGTLSGGVTPISAVNRYGFDNVIPSQRDDLTSSNSIIRTRFSAPGGPEINTRGYLDIGSQEFSVYNALPYRNTTVLGSGSGEATTIRVDSQASRREGLRTHLRRHSGRFGIDSVHGYVTDTYVVGDASFEKTNRNTRVIPDLTSSALQRKNYDNGFVTRPIPSQDYGYAWVTASLNHALAPSTVRKTPAQASIYIVANPSADDTVTVGDGVDTVIFTFKASAGSATEVTIGGDNDVTRANLKTKMAVQFPDMTITDQTILNRLLLTNSVSGTLGNFALSETMGGSPSNIVSGFSGGEDLAQQLAFGFWPAKGIINTSADVNWRNNGFDSAVNFPTASFGNGLVGVYS
jgi:hypothetical protein